MHWMGIGFSDLVKIGDDRGGKTYTYIYLGGRIKKWYSKEGKKFSAIQEVASFGNVSSLHLYLPTSI